jgi:enediyne biosynthesis protein E4
MPLMILINNGKKLSDQTSQWIKTPASGWWNCLTAADFDKDGDIDLVAGNYGANNQFNVSADHPATMVFKDFNNDGEIDPFFCYYINGKSYPYASRDEALGQVSFLKTRFTDYTAYSNSTLETMFTPDELKGANTLKADMLKTVYLQNNGNSFEVKELPVQAQFAPVYSIASFDLDQDGDLDLVMAGNESNVRVRLGKSDANKGFVFLNDGKGRFEYMPQFKSGLNLTGDIRDLVFIASRGKQYLLTTATGDSIRSYRLNK